MCKTDWLSLSAYLTNVSPHQMVDDVQDLKNYGVNVFTIPSLNYYYQLAHVFPEEVNVVFYG